MASLDSPRRDPRPQTSTIGVLIGILFLIASIAWLLLAGHHRDKPVKFTEPSPPPATSTQ